MKRSIHLASLAAIASTTMLIACSGGGGNNATASGSGPANRQPGLWETSAKVTALELTGASPEMQARANARVGQVQTANECVTPEMVRDPVAQMRAMMARQGATANCQFLDQVWGGGVIRVRARCPAAQGGSAEIAIEGSFTETTMRATMNVTASGPASAEMPGVTGLRLTAETNGRRVGECPGSNRPANTM